MTCNQRCRFVRNRESGNCDYCCTAAVVFGRTTSSSSRSAADHTNLLRLYGIGIIQTSCSNRVGALTARTKCRLGDQKLVRQNTKLCRFFMTKRERNSYIEIHEHTDHVELWKRHHSNRNFFVDAADNGLFEVAPCAQVWPRAMDGLPIRSWKFSWWAAVATLGCTWSHVARPSQARRELERRGQPWKDTPCCTRHSMPRSLVASASISFRVSKWSNTI